MTKKFWQSKKWLAAMIGFLVITFESIYYKDGGELPPGIRDLILAKGLALAAYLFGQSYVDAKTQPVQAQLDAMGKMGPLLDAAKDLARPTPPAAAS